MSAWARFKVAVVAGLLLWLRPRLLRWSDETWGRVLHAACRLVPPARPVLAEAIEILEDGPPGTTLIRDMVERSTEAEIRDLVWGLLAFRPWGPGGPA